ncbi:hypothetical protein [Nocardia sp. CNY236]|uniref:hypothetical protein n=1 Tax=Nocardia sp. CNY236 TaxID=1169152 RepID=UPI0003FBCC60|nr:hypothetical protein [Nocardia sp. CNY236]
MPAASGAAERGIAVAADTPPGWAAAVTTRGVAVVTDEVAVSRVEAASARLLPAAVVCAALAAVRVRAG